jgi:hypothetical protein
LLAGESSGYKSVLAGCTSTEKGIVIRYRITAVPIARGLTGVRAFCADESGTLFYEENGSATECLSLRLPLFWWKLSPSMKASDSTMISNSDI